MAGANARLRSHGRKFKVPVVRLTTKDGACGIGLFGGNRIVLESIIGLKVGSLISSRGVSSQWLDVECPIWDLQGRIAGRPVHSLLASAAGRKEAVSVRAPCYDTSLLIDDLHLTRDDEAADFIASEAADGVARGHRAFKVKVGRGARHMPLDAGTRRDVAIVRAVRELLPKATLLLDANNGYNLNLTKQILDSVGDCKVTWIEEPFGEDPVLYEDLKTWLNARGLETLIADGEYSASTDSLLEWANLGLIDVLQFDILGHGLTEWVATRCRLHAPAVRTAPHNYGLGIGNFVVSHLAAALPNFAFVEWDEAAVDGIEAPGYRIQDGMVTVPDEPGFGFVVDEPLFAQAVASTGFVIRA